MKKVPHPIPYQGSKRKLASVILQYFPPNIDKLIEPFAGSAAISIATMAHNLAKNCVINDLNTPLVKLLEMIVINPYEGALRYEQLWNMQIDDPAAFYAQVRSDFNQSQDPCLLLYLLVRCIKNSVRYNSNGLFNQSPDNRRLGTSPKVMRDNIVRMSDLLAGKSQFLSLNYTEILSSATALDLVYMDPPYQGVCGEKDTRYLSGIDHNSFITSLDELNGRNISYIVSYDGRRGDKNFGELLPATLNLTRIEINAGRSSQSTLLGRNEVTYESLYLSPALVDRNSVHLTKIGE